MTDEPLAIPTLKVEGAKTYTTKATPWEITTPMANFRWLKVPNNPTSSEAVLVTTLELQQQFCISKGESVATTEIRYEWRAVPVVEEEIK